MKQFFIEDHVRFRHPNSPSVRRGPVSSTRDGVAPVPTSPREFLAHLEAIRLESDFLSRAIGEDCIAMKAAEWNKDFDKVREIMDHPLFKDHLIRLMEISGISVDVPK